MILPGTDWGGARKNETQNEPSYCVESSRLICTRNTRECSISSSDSTQQLQQAEAALAGEKAALRFAVAAHKELMEELSGKKLALVSDCVTALLVEFACFHSHGLRFSTSLFLFLSPAIFTVGRSGQITVGQK